jgi:TonB family protein
MQRHAKSGPDPSQPIRSTESALRAPVDDVTFDTDFANLAARFGAQSGGTLSLELCADLALEIVLNEIVEQACLATGATGAAIVLERDGELVCRASSGATAPELGARLDRASGISGECVKTRKTRRSDDVLEDPRVDLEASKRLGVRSVIVMPLLRGAEMVGVIELFSFRPNAFTERDERTLEALGRRTVRNLDRASEQIKQLEQKQVDFKHPETERFENKPSEPKQLERKQLEPKQPVLPSEVTRVPETLGSIPVSDRQGSPRRGFDLVTWTFAAAVVACAIWLGVLLGKPSGLEKVKVMMRTYPKAVSAAPARAPAIPAPIPPPNLALSPAPSPAPSPGASQQGESVESSALQSLTKPTAEAPVPAGSLQVFENGKEVYRMPAAQKKAVPSFTKAAELASMKTDDVLLHRVEPEYPEQAREQKIQGVVVLEVRVGADGGVQDVRAVSGPPLLIKASADAVKQWRFKPHTSNGHPVEMQSRVRLNFRLPE